MVRLNYQVCKGCGVRFLEANFLPHRVSGYCTEECLHHEPRGVSTAEGIGWKNGISATSQRKRFTPLPPSSESPRKWTFEMVHHFPPFGWQIESWRLADTSLPPSKRKAIATISSKNCMS